jgi:hypothetical protein
VPVVHLVGLFWPWLLPSFGCAVIIGATAVAPARLGGWLVLGALLFAAGLAAAQMQWLAGRAGLWLEMALMLFAAYGAGCCLGALIRRAARKTA